MKYRLILSALLAWLPLGLHSEPFTYESAAELSTALDASGDGRADLVVVDKATGVRQLAIQQADGSFAWAEPRATGLDGVTALTAGRFKRGSWADGIAVAAPGWNRVHVVPNPSEAGVYFNAVAPGIGPNLVVALDMGGGTGLDDLAIATCWEDPPSDSRLYASAWNGITANNLYDLVEGQSGPLTHGNRAWLSNTSSLLVGMMRPTGATSEFLTRIPGTSGYDLGPAVTGLPPGATWVWGVFDASGYSQFLFYAPGASSLQVRPVEELTPGVLSFGSGAAFDLGEPIQQVCVLPQSVGALLLVVFGDGATAGLYDFDGHNLPVLRQALTAPLGNLFTVAGALGDGDLLLLHGPAGGGGTSTGWERWGLDGLQHTLAGSGSLPAFTPAAGRANVFVYRNDPARDPDPDLMMMAQVGDWSVEVQQRLYPAVITFQNFVDSVTGLGDLATMDFSFAHAPFYLQDYYDAESVIVVNQSSASASVACLSPALGRLVGEVAFNPPPGAYPPGAAGGLTVRLTATPDAPVHFRTDPSLPWTLYSAASPPSLTSNTTLWAYADSPTGFSYYDHDDNAWHYAVVGMYTPIRTATYRIAAPPALEPAPQTDANGDGLGDAWAAAFGLSDPLADPDGDGANNRAEFASSSDPFDPASLPPAVVTHTVTFRPGEHGRLAGDTPTVTETVNHGAPPPLAPTVTPEMNWVFSAWSPTLPTTITADVETTAQYAHPPQHQADQNRDWIIQLDPELTRLIQFYNSAGYHPEAGTEDGYAPGAGDETGLAHQADQNHDWIIQLWPELTRLIQFYNRGGYHPEAGTEDGYAPNLVAGKGASAAGILTSAREVGASTDAAGRTLDVSVTLTHSAPAALTSLMVQETLPAGWTFLGVVNRPAPQIAPAVGTTGFLGFAWIKAPTIWPVKLTYRVSVPAGSPGVKSLRGMASFRADRGEIAVETSASPVAAPVAAGRGWFDLSGAYSTAVAGNPLTLEVVHDTAGKLTGMATLQVNTDSRRVPVTMSVKGLAKGSSGALVARLVLQGHDDARAIRVALTLDLDLDAAARQLVGRARGRIALGPVVTPVSQTVTLDLPGPMDGTWTLGLELAPFGATAVGSATLTLSNGVAHHLAVTGKARGATTTLTLSGLPMNPAAKDIRIMATIEAAKTPLPPLFFLSGRGYGQRVGRLGVGDAGQ